MADTTYAVELAKSGRSTCKGCKETIAKGVLRIQSTQEKVDLTVTGSYHLACFNKPRKYKDVDDFMENGLTDNSGGDILPEKYDEIKAAIQSKKPKKKPSSEETKNPIAEIKELFESQAEDNPTKKQKNEQVEAYAKYHKMKLDECKDILRWNHQILKGTKNVVLFKLIDGHVHGRIALCGTCGGKLKMSDGCDNVECMGTFDKDTQTKYPCDFTCSLEEAPRWKWCVGVVLLVFVVAIIVLER